MFWVPFGCVFLTALLVVLVTTPLARTIAIRLGAVDRPGGRRINRTPVPRMGGIAIMLALVVAALVQWVGTTYLSWPVVVAPSPKMDVNYYMVALAVGIIFATGAIDDVVSLKPLPKLAGQLIAATVAAAGGLIIGDIANPLAPGEIALGWLAYPITIIYLAAFANIINLIDGLDGLASGITCLASLTMFVLAMNAHRIDAATLAIVVCGATLGFLRHNFNPASIFLGDSGSLTLGFLLGVISLLSVTRFAGLTTMLLPLVLAGIPIIDTFSAIVRRSRAHVSVGQADKGHIHHRLIQEGFDQRQAVVLIYLWTAALCLGSVVMTQVGTLLRIIVFGALLAGSVAFAIKLHLFQPVLLHHYDAESDEDTLIDPDDPDFEDEARRQHME